MCPLVCHCYYSFQVFGLYILFYISPQGRMPFLKFIFRDNVNLGKNSYGLTQVSMIVAVKDCIIFGDNNISVLGWSNKVNLRG